MNSEEIINKGIQAGYNVELAKQYGIVAAIVLNRLVFLHKNTPREDSYTWQTAKDWEEYTGLSDYQVKKALDKLAELKIIEIKNTYIVGTQIKCRHQRFILSQKNAQNLKSDFQETSKSETKETSKSEMAVSSKSVNSIEHNIEHNIEHKKERRKEKTFEEIFEEKQIKGELKKAFVELIKSRKLNNRKMTDRALELSINKVRRMSQDEETQIAIVNQSIENGWQGLFPLKEAKSTKTVAHITRPGEDRTWKRVFDFWEKALGYKPSESEAEVSAARQLLELEGEANTQKLIVALRMRSEHRYLPSVVKNVADLEGLLANRESVWAFYTKNEREWAGWHEKQQEGKKRWEL